MLLKTKLSVQYINYLVLGLLYTLVEELQISFGHFGCDCNEKSQSLCPDSLIWIPFLY